MKGIIFAILGGMFITLQGVVNAGISRDIGILPAITVTQFTGFLLALTILLVVKDGSLTQLKTVKWPYLFAGSFGLLVIFNEVTAINMVGVTFTMAVILISQIVMAVLIDTKGWFGLKKQKIKLPQVVGISLMILGVIIIQL
ncbi:DMT family transporter [Alteribacter keqinensis]|uniref:DMT family transporter n=1 Tax=Alteribacter keqinensis TaxID=2483800 RepID=A0A3M7TNY5_9BACI|nr:DMT family transporter [Alteribacter keqinensis]RNA66964.1 DMT family transporter [Alteribacter keqinensis]